MKKAVFILFITLSSCHFFEKQVPSEKELLTKELQQINWNEVDEYPSIENCNKLTNTELQKQCFFEFFTSTIQQKIGVDTLCKQYPKLDTIKVIVTVFPDATLQFKPQFSRNATFDTIKIDSIFQSRLLDFPKVSPAIKRGIPVKTQFELPIAIKSRN